MPLIGLPRKKASSRGKRRHLVGRQDERLAHHASINSQSTLQGGCFAFAEWPSLRVLAGGHFLN
jgi:hypothetical protein